MKILFSVVLFFAGGAVFQWGQEMKNPTISAVGAFSVVASLYFLMRALASRRSRR